MRRRNWTILAILILLVIMQMLPVDRSNPPIQGEVAVSAELSAILKQSCYDCHSNETVWPWYSRVAPVSWVLAGHVKEGREHLNFSEWTSIDATIQPAILHHIYKEVEEGEMPLKGYLMLHPEAKMDEGALDALRVWTGSDDEE